MALSQTYVKTMEVRNALGEDCNRVRADLCRSPFVNKWSRIKPIADDIHSPDFATLNANMKLKHFGLTIPDFVHKTNQAWAYNQPTAVNSGRLGDFRGYYHNALLPYKIQDFDGQTNEAGYTGQLKFHAAINLGGGDEQIGIGDFAALNGYVLGAEVWTATINGGTLEDPNFETVDLIGWTTGENPSLTEIEFDFTKAPFLNHINSILYFNFFLASAAIPFTTTTPQVVTLKALNADSENKTQQYVHIVDEPVNLKIPEIEIIGLREKLTLGDWQTPGSVLGDPSTYLSTEKSLAIKLKFKSWGNYSGATFKLKTSPTHITNATYDMNIMGMLYDLSGNSISSIPLNTEFIIYGNFMNRDANGVEYSTVPQGLTNWVTFTLSGSYLGQYNSVKSFVKVITT